MEKTLPIINGSFNPRFLLNDFQELPDLQSKQQTVWYLLKSIGNKESYPDVDHLVFSGIIEPPSLPVNEHKEILEKSEEELTKLFSLLQVAKELYKQNLLMLTKQRSREKGQQIYRLQQKLGFGGFLEMDLNRLKGYMEECGGWNDFNPAKISQKLNSIEKACPRKDYGVNNPSTGLPMHIYRTVSGCEYVNIYFPFLSEREVEKVVEFYKNVWEPVGQEVIADSVRMVEEKDGPYSSIELIWWWD
jgi:hypothetical protein